MAKILNQKNYSKFFSLVTVVLGYGAFLSAVAVEGRRLETRPADSAGFTFLNAAYGKNLNKVMYVRRDGARHSIKELEVSIQLSLTTEKDYTAADNHDIVATDTQKHTVYVLAKKYGIKSPEEFGLRLARHFVKKYPTVLTARIYLEECGWDRLKVQGVEHNHAFVATAGTTRFANIKLKRGEEAEVDSGLKNLRVMKTTQSGFEDFIQDEYTLLPNVKDRMWSTNFYARWTYNSSTNSDDAFDYDGVWSQVKTLVLDTFAGPADTGVYSPSVQNTMYLIEKQILETLPTVSNVELECPNIHYGLLDLSKFERLIESPNKEVYMRLDAAPGNMKAALTRKA